jgi:hypothetical protein
MNINITESRPESQNPPFLVENKNKEKSLVYAMLIILRRANKGQVIFHLLGTSPWNYLEVRVIHA